MKKKHILILLFLLVPTFIFAAEKSTAKEWIDTSVLYMLDSFSGNIGYFIFVALRLARLMVLLMLLWNFIQMVIGTMEGKKVFIGSITKWLFFLLALHLYPGFSYGLRTLAIEMGIGASGSSIQSLTKALGEYMDELEILSRAVQNNELKALETELKGSQSLYELYKKEYEENKAKYDAAVEAGYPVIAAQNELIAAELRMKNASKEVRERQKQVSEVASNPNGQSRTLEALKSVLVKNGKSTTSKYRLDISLKNANGKDTGLISPNAMFRVGILAGQIMWEKEWTVINEEWELNKSNGNLIAKTADFLTFPVYKLFDLVLCIICIITLVIVLACCLIQYIMSIIEYTITSSFAIVLLPCMIFDPFKDLAQKILPTLFAQAVKLVFITMAMFFSCWTFLQLAMNISEQASGFDFTTFGYVMFTGLLTAAFCINAPKWAQTLLTGQPQMSMGEFVATAAAAGGIAAMTKRAGDSAVNTVKTGAQRAGNAAINAAGNLSAMSGAASQAKVNAAASGKGNFGQRIAAMGGAAREGATRFTGSLKENAENFFKNGGKKSSDGSNRSSLSAADKTTGDTNNTRDFTRHKIPDKNGQTKSSTIGEYLKAQRESGMNNQKK